MNFDWSKFGKFSEWLEKVDDSEVDEETRIRNMISRMSYHAYHCLLNWVGQHSSYKIELGEQTHKSLINHLYKIKKTDKAKWYKQLKEYREQCDYDDEILSLKDTLNKSKILYYHIIDSLSQYSIKPDIQK